MHEKLLIKNNPSKQEVYLTLISQINNLLDNNDKLISNLANLSAAIMQSLPRINWAGFYLADKDQLYLGPFQGKIACSKINFGRGVCGTAAVKKQTIIVSNVYQFPDHIFCDSDSKSEIVVPIIINNSTWGVLDIDSPDFNRFDQLDKKYLEEIIELLKKNIINYELSGNSKEMASTTI